MHKLLSTATVSQGVSNYNLFTSRFPQYGSSPSNKTMMCPKMINEVGLVKHKTKGLYWPNCFSGTAAVQKTQTG